MKKEAFIRENSEGLENLAKISQTVGARIDYVQGGGGNTSAKLGGSLMAIKASGFRLSEVTPEDGYAVMDYEALREFYNTVQPEGDFEARGEQRAKELTLQVEGLKPLRPSVEAGFHAALDKYVVHSHSTYANLLTCCDEGEELMRKAMQGMGEAYCSVAYTNPGVKLTYAIIDAMKKAEAETGKKPSVIFMENHGVVTTSDDADEALRLHAQVNTSAAALFGVAEEDYPKTSLQEKDGLIYSRTEWLKNELKGCDYPLEFFTVDTLYPDQLVFLAGSLAVVDKMPDTFTEKCTIVRETGDIVYTCVMDGARTIEETLVAVLYIVGLLGKNGYKLRTMDAAGKKFIENWEGEAYRRGLVIK